MPDAASFATLDDFVLRRRFPDLRGADAPPESRPRLRPLTPAAASRIAGDAESRCAASSASATTTFRTDDSPGIVKERLHALPIAATTEILVSWNGATAVLTDWGFFRDRWGDFCYPASDDVTIWSPNEPWTVCYRRFEVLQFRAGAS